VRRPLARLLAITMLVPAVVAGATTHTAHASGNTWFDRYVAMEAAIGDDFAGSHDSAVLGWDESYVLNSYLDVYALTRDTGWLDRLVAQVDQVIANADDAVEWVVVFGAVAWPADRDGSESLALPRGQSGVRRPGSDRRTAWRRVRRGSIRRACRRWP
jgi:hypothetical protein